MTPEHAQLLARYNRWINEKVYAVAAKLSDDERKRDRGAFFKSIHGTLNHLMVGDRVWMGRFIGAPLEDGCMGPGGIRTLDQELHSDFEEMRRQRVNDDIILETYVQGLTADRLLSGYRYVRGGVTHENPLWWDLAHLFNHQTHHRGQLTTLLMQAGHDPGPTDLLVMVRQEAAQGRVFVS